MTANHTAAGPELCATIESLADAERTYRESAAEIESGELRKLFGELSEQCGRFAAALRAEVRRFEVTAQEPPGMREDNVESPLRRQCTPFGRSESTIVAKAERAADQAEKMHRRVLKIGNLPAETCAMLERQYKHLQQSHNRIIALDVVNGSEQEAYKR